MIIRPTDQRKRNELARIQIIKVVEENGLKWGFVATKLNMDQSNFTHWRNERYEFGSDKLKAIENFIDRYLNF